VSSDPRSPEDSESPFRRRILLAVALGLNLPIVLFVEYVPFADAWNHLARWQLIHDAVFTDAGPAYVTVRPIFTSYVVVDAVGVLLVHLLPAELALKVVAALALVLLPLGTWAVLGSVAPRQRDFAVVGALLALNWAFFYGFLSYVVGMGLALLVLAWWWGSNAPPSPTKVLLAGLAAGGLYLVHMSAALVVLLALGLDWLVLAGPTLRRPRPPLRRMVLNPYAASLVSAIVFVGILYAIGNGAAAAGSGEAMLFRAPVDKLRQLGSPFFSFSSLQASVIAGGYALAATVLYVPELPRLAWSVPVLMPLFLLFAFFVAPAYVTGAYDVDVRFLLPALLLAFAIPVRGPARRRRAASLAVLWAAAVAHGAICFSIARGVSGELADYRAVLDAVPAGGVVLPVVADGNRHGRVDTYRHFALIVDMERRARAPYLFEGGTLPHLAYFTVTDPLYLIPETWGTREFGELDWSRIRADYGWIVQAGPEPRARAIIAEEADLVFSRGEAALFRLRPPD
jgi:hypothetical protein